MIISNCSKDTNWMDQAEITGFDPSLCACCGGIFIKIDDDIFSFDRIPEGSSVSLSSESTFPIPVNINWHPMEGACSSNRVTITEMEPEE